MKSRHIMENKLVQLASNAQTILHDNHDWIVQAKREVKAENYHRLWKTGGLAKLHKSFTRHYVNDAVAKLEQQGYQFTRQISGAVTYTSFSLQDIHRLCEHFELPTLQTLNPQKKAFVGYVLNLKGGVGKSVVLSTLAHGLVLNDPLITLRMRVLVIDLDPQSSASLFLHHQASIGDKINTAALAMVQPRTREELQTHFVQKTTIPNVDIIPAALTDSFMANALEQIADQQSQPLETLLLERLVKPLEDDYDVILLDTGPHMDAMMLNALRAANGLLIPIAPTSVDFDSSLRFLMRLPEMMALAYGHFAEADEDIAQVLAELEKNTPLRLQMLAGFMSKYSDSEGAKNYRSLVKQLFGSDFLKDALPDLAPFRKSGDTYDTVFSVSPSVYDGDSSGSLKSAIAAAQDFSYGVFDEIAVAQKLKLERRRG
ncbi:MAG: ParA family protein [Enterovibrio sp.]